MLFSVEFHDCFAHVFAIGIKCNDPKHNQKSTAKHCFNIFKDIYGDDVSYRVIFHDDFVPEWKSLAVDLKKITGEVLDHLEDAGPFLGRPEVGTLNCSRHANMKEIRVRFGREVWRFAFAFDPDQSAIILCGGDKQGMTKMLFYKRLIAKADMRFDTWLVRK